MCVLQELVLEKGTKQLSGSLIWVIKFAFIFYSRFLFSNLAKLGFSFSNTLFFPAYPVMKFSSMGISFDNFCEAFFRSSEHGSILAFIPLKCSVNLNKKSCQLSGTTWFVGVRKSRIPQIYECASSLQKDHAT